MANIKSAKKRARQSEQNRQRNASARSMVRTTIKNVVKAIDAKDKARAEAAFKIAEPVMDRYAARGLIHKNKVARHKSRLTAHIAALVRVRDDPVRSRKPAQAGFLRLRPAIPPPPRSARDLAAARAPNRPLPPSFSPDPRSSPCAHRVCARAHGEVLTRGGVARRASASLAAWTSSHAAATNYW